MQRINSQRPKAHQFICSKRGFCKYNWSCQLHFITRWMCLCEQENFHSVNIQVSCDAQMKLTKTVARCPGSMNNSFILTNMVGNRLQAGPMQDGNNSWGINNLFGQKWIPLKGVECVHPWISAWFQHPYSSLLYWREWRGRRLVPKPGFWRFWAQCHPDHSVSNGKLKDQLVF